MARRARNKGKCLVNNCEMQAKYHHPQYCDKHYGRFRKHGDPLAGRIPNGESMRYLLNVLRNPFPAECMIWPYRSDPQGYARVHNGPVDYLVHRLACEIIHGPQPSKELSNVAHSCGKGSSGCFNPNHLRWATYSQNENDKLDHGTHNRGEQSGKHKLTEHDVKLIRSFCDQKLLSHSKLSSMFGVSAAQISRIRNRIDWNWLK